MKSLGFMIVGAQKSGTTALASFLAEHPELALATGKEVHLFDAEDYSSAWTVAEINARYSCHFPADTQDAVLGEATPIYCYWTEIAAELARYNPQLKIIVMLRDPVERAISQYMMEKNRGDEHLPLWLALILEPLRLAFGRSRATGSAWRVHSYAERGFYCTQLEAYRRVFPDRQILVLENNDLRHSHAATLSRVYKFLEVAAHPPGESRKIFAGGYEKKSDWFSRWFLQRRFRAANRQLKILLLRMGYRANWQWLE